MRAMVAPGGAFSGENDSSRLAHLGVAIRRRWTDWAERRRMRAVARVLYNCTDHELHDMGLNRGDIPAVVNGTYRPD